jgi:ketosteroid isomerase-like protein
MCAPPDGWQDAIAANNQAAMDAVARKDAAAFAAVYTTNGNALPPNNPTVTGTGALRQFWQAVIDMGITGVTLETVELEGFEDTAIEVGAYTLEGEGGGVLDKGKFVVIWKLEDGVWKWHHDIWNSSVTPAA